MRRAARRCFAAALALERARPLAPPARPQTAKHAHRPPRPRPQRPLQLGRLTTEAGALLDVLGGSLGTLGALTAPIHSRAAALTAAQRNVAATKAEADALLDHLDTSRRVGPTLAAGPAADLPAFLEALEALERSVAFLQGHARLAAVQAALGAGQALFNRALETCHADFAATLAAAARDGAPPPAWLQRHLGDAITGAGLAVEWDGVGGGGWGAFGWFT